MREKWVNFLGEAWRWGVGNTIPCHLSVWESFLLGILGERGARYVHAYM